MAKADFLLPNLRLKPEAIHKGLHPATDQIIDPVTDPPDDENQNHGSEGDEEFELPITIFIGWR